ncbi:hypothetical protein PFISCL1PPCAC_11070, partial [Pristionchus fissidentatus]
MWCGGCAESGLRFSQQLIRGEVLLPLVERLQITLGHLIGRLGYSKILLVLLPTFAAARRCWSFAVGNGSFRFALLLLLWVL